ncbi:MAG: hypothetical protein N2109_06775 [Fimbriimonadales bacterium]|nr:hypothetical protein [Fimbriimonadales bacterium]
MEGLHFLWLGVTALCLLWYGTITLYVAVRGGRDIGQMLRNLSKLNGPREPEGR